MLSDEQLEIVWQDIEKSGVSIQSLQDDLLDHMCCFIECKLEEGASFEDAYALAQQQVCPNGLQEIQEETLYLLNSNRIIAMKKIMYAIGLVSSIGISIGWLSKLLYWPIGGELFTYSFLGFAFLFLPMLAFDRYKIGMGKEPSEKLRTILGFASALITGFAVAFKILHLQGANVMLVVGIFLFTFGFLPFLFFRMYKKAIS